VCGPDLDQALVSFTADLDHLRGLGVDIARHNLANDPGAFVAEPVVRGFLEVVGSDGLPLVVVDGVTVATGRYPSRQELLRYAGRVPDGASGSGPVQVLPTPQHRSDLGLSPATAAGCC
jgi:arsenite-transporting ATPase